MDGRLLSEVCRVEEIEPKHGVIDIRAWQKGDAQKGAGTDYASVDDGWMGMAFLATCLKSSAKQGAWTSMPKKI